MAKVSGSGQWLAPWSRIRIVLQVQALKSIRPPFPAAAAAHGSPGLAGSLLFRFPGGLRLPTLLWAPPAPARTREKSGRRVASVPQRGSQGPGPPPLSCATAVTASFSRFRTLPGFHSGKALQEEEGETQASCSWINDHNLLFKTNFEEATGHMDATEFRCAVGDTE